LVCCIPALKLGQDNPNKLWRKLDGSKIIVEIEDENVDPVCHVPDEAAVAFKRIEWP